MTWKEPTVAEDLDPSEHVPVLAGVADPARARRGQRWRRVGVLLMALVVVAACLGWLGPRETSVSADGLEVTYPQLTRPGVDATVEVALPAVDTDAPVVLEISAVAYDRLGIETITPTPASETTAGDAVRLTFDAPATPELSVRLAGRTPTRTTLGPFTFSIRVASSGSSPAEAELRTWVLP